MITAIILSKDRPAQLDLLLGSGAKNTDQTWDVRIVRDNSGPGFENAIWRSLQKTKTDYTCFMCDDGILYRPITEHCLPMQDEICFSLRLGDNTTVQYPTAMEQTPPEELVWNWTLHHDNGDFGYPGSIDGHIFRTADLIRMLDCKRFPNPTALECALVQGCEELADELPLMARARRSSYVGNPINRVSDQSGVRYGTKYPITAAECNRLYAAGQRIDLDALDFTSVNGAHTEIELVWK